MTIDEAISYIETRAKDLEFQGFDREAQAQNLGIEALRDKKTERIVFAALSQQLLKGETDA